MNKFFYILSIFFFCFSCVDTSNHIDILVNNNNELQSVIKNIKAGDVITLANGIWKDVEIEFYGRGTKNNPIILKAETSGKVTIEGASSLSVGGEYLEVRGLHFKNGYTPSKTVIQFKINDDKVANHCKVTQCVIEEFTQPDRHITDHWVEFWGQNNELSNCYITGKSNFGPTVRVFLKGNEHIKNYHQIINNHFGPRPRKGGPHGETMQIGDSGTSMAPSHTYVANNLFDHCNGEVEIISSKSNFNEFRNNVFFESEGSLVLRHGNYATIDGNIFIGNEKSKFIGGIRVINTGHWITNNYFYKLKGTTFRAPLAVMNGIPKSPLNRYNQVTDAVIAYNSYIDCKTPFHFSVGSNVSQSDVLPASEIRSARPVRTIIANNLIYNSKIDNYPIKNYDKVDGVIFKKNILNSENKSDVKPEGLMAKDIKVNKISERLYVPVLNYKDIYSGFDFETITTDLFGTPRTIENNSVGAILKPIKTNTELIDKSKYGTNWFSTKSIKNQSTIISISSNIELVKQLKLAKPGDVLSLKPGSYSIDDSLVINKDVTISSEDKNDKAVLIFTSNNAAFQMYPKGNLRIENVVLSGNKTQDAFSTLDKNMSKAYNLFLNTVEISNFKSVLEVSKGSFADTISISNSVIKNCKKGLCLNKENDAKGDYNAEFVLISNSEFNKIDENVLNYFRGGYDESTIGGNLLITNSVFTNCGAKEENGMLLSHRGIVNVNITKNIFKNNAVKYVAILWGAKNNDESENQISNSGIIKTEENLKMKLMY
mgnify:CR=1 FL=1|tara:strand:- start:45334 stop:47640 length:2307 start_codon:yes stop_codon:yes gene_type:complete